MRRPLSKLLLLSTGAALAWFLDPVTGADRRRQVADRLAGLTGGSTAGGDPTGGAAPSVPAAPPAPEGDAVLAQAVEAASGGEKVLQPPPEPGTEAESDRGRTLRANW
jgi:hypothetical protein